MIDDLTIYKQIHPSQCVKLAELGYRSVLNVRPDAEAQIQPNGGDFVSATADSHLNYHHLPFDDERLSMATVQQFADLYHSMPKPILMFCGTGTRAKLLYQSALVQGLL